MRLPIRDLIATLLVAIGLLLTVGWAVGLDVSIASGVRPVALAVLVLGVAASVSAVVPGFSELLRGSRPYLAVTSALGIVAFIAGILALLWAEPIALGVLIGATVLLWALSTTRHLAGATPHSRTHA